MTEQRGDASQSMAGWPALPFSPNPPPKVRVLGEHTLGGRSNKARLLAESGAAETTIKRRVQLRAR